MRKFVLIASAVAFVAGATSAAYAEDSAKTGDYPASKTGKAVPMQKAPEDIKSKEKMSSSKPAKMDEKK